MNREQRRKARFENVPVDQIVWPWDMTIEECKQMAIGRVITNTHETGHPYHHKTANGVIVTPDPTLDYYISRLSEEQQTRFRDIYTPTPEQEASAAKAFPVNRTFYGHDMYKGH